VPCVCLAVALVWLPYTGRSIGSAWQDEGHLLVNRVAAEHLPDDMPAFFREAVERLAYLGPEPDRWRRNTEYSLKESQEPDHFIKLEILDVDLDTLRSRYDYYRILYESRASSNARSGLHPDSLLPEHVGLLPYISIEEYERLKVAFRQYRQLRASGDDTGLVEGNVILYAGWLGHYVADAANPHHTSVHYNGWQGPNPEGYAGPGVHARFEGDFVRSAGIRAEDLSDRLGPPEFLRDPFADFLGLIYESQTMVEEVYRLDRDGGFAGAGSADGREFAGSADGREFTLSRLAAASQMLLNLWYTAWVASADE
jgi:hypothetical protein